MDALTAAQAFQVRELHAARIWSGRIAELLGIEERLVRDALNRTGSATGDPIDVEELVEPPHHQPDPPSSRTRGWAPPAADSTSWQVITALRTGEKVRVRTVTLWGQRVQIDVDERVYCPACGDFHTVEQLGAPDNHCPVGIIRHGAILRFDSSTDPGPRTVSEFMRAPW